MLTIFQRLILRYGVFFLIILMSTGILYLVFNFELRTKTPIHLYFDHHDNSWYGYISGPPNVPFTSDDTLYVVQTAIGDIPFVVKHLKTEEKFTKMNLKSIEDHVLPNDFYEGFVYIGTEKLKDKVLHNNFN